MYVVKIIPNVIAFLILILFSSSSGENQSDWKYSKLIEITSSMSKYETNNNKVVLVKLIDATELLSQCKKDGCDIRFYNVDDSTALNYFIDKWSMDLNIAFIYVKLKDSDTDKINMLWGNEAASCKSSSTDVFGENADKSKPKVLEKVE